MAFSPDITRFSAQGHSGLSVPRPEYQGYSDMPGGLIELDIDRAPASGADWLVSALCPGVTRLVTDARIDLFWFDEATQTVELSDANNQLIGQAAAVLIPGVLEIEVLQWMPDSADPVFAAAILGPISESTDCVSNSGYLVSAIAAPTATATMSATGLSWLMLRLALLGAVAIGRSNLATFG